MATTYHCLYVHIVFATKGRAPSIAKGWEAELHALLGAVAKRLETSPLIVGGVADHVHLLLRIKASQAVSDLVREIKKASSDWAERHFDKFAWQTGYGAFSVSPGEVGKTVIYIQNQEEHHRKVSSGDELRAMLGEFGIEFDERYIE